MVLYRFPGLPKKVSGGVRAPSARLWCWVMNVKPSTTLELVQPSHTICNISGIYGDAQRVLVAYRNPLVARA